MESVWSDIRCTRRLEDGEVEEREEIRVLKYSWSCCARWVFPEVGYPVRIIS